MVTVPGSPHKRNDHITAKIMSAAKTLNFSTNDDLTFDGCSNGITLFAVPWRTANANNTDLAEERYFNEATLKSPADIKQHVMGSKFEPPQSLQGLVQVFTNYIQLRDALDTHKRLLENRITLVLMINLLWKVHQDSCQFFIGCEQWGDGEPFPRSTLQATVEALMDAVHINTTLTCLVAEFLGSSTPAIKHDKRDPGGTGKPAGGHGQQPTRNTAIPPICAAAVREVNCLYPTMSISDFA